MSRGNEVVVPASGETAEDIARASAVIRKGVILGGDLNIISPCDDLDSTFLALSLSNGEPKRNLARKAQGKSVVHLRNSDLEPLSFYFPELSEQKRIAKYFRELDELVSKHALQLEKLRNIKSACLEKMFV
jgi:type I restriction enzyme S subunit